MSMESISYGEFSREVHDHFANQRFPIEASLEVTRRCPLVCQHCYNNLPMGDLAARKRELTKEEYEKILSEMADLGVIWLLFTGGEIFARKDFLEIYTFAKKKGFLITLFTNGILINETIADYLREYPPFAIEITLYGRTRETYEALTRLPGSFDRCMRGIRLLLDRGLPLKLKTVGTKINRHEVLEMKEFAVQELGVEFKFDSSINPRIDCSHAPLSVRLSPEEVVALEMSWPKLSSELSALLKKGLAAQPRPSNAVYVCGGGDKSFAVDPYGFMTICVISHREGYDIRNGSLREGWEQYLFKVRKRQVTKTTKCTACRLRFVCGMCPANGELESGDPESPVDFLCEVAHLRALSLGYKVPEHGVCEFCAEGSRREQLIESAQRISSGAINVEACSSSTPLLPVLNNSEAASGCGGCGANH
jgi:radical SAM protein with 4Fe4S-binding SPASM domain